MLPGNRREAVGRWCRATRAHGAAACSVGLGESSFTTRKCELPGAQRGEQTSRVDNTQHAL